MVDSTQMLQELPLERLSLIGLAWLCYFALHSLLASLAVKRWVARQRSGWMPAYRLVFNAMALVLLLPPVVLTYWERGPWLWEWTGSAWWLANALAAAAAFGFLYSLRWYDGLEFLGLRQWRGAANALARRAPSAMRNSRGTGDSGHGVPRRR